MSDEHVFGFDKLPDRFCRRSEVVVAVFEQLSGDARVFRLVVRVVNLESWTRWAFWASWAELPRIFSDQVQLSSAQLSVFEEGPSSASSAEIADWAGFQRSVSAQLSSAQKNFDPVQLSSAQLSKIFHRSSSAQLSSTKIFQIYNSEEINLTHL